MNKNKPKDVVRITGSVVEFDCTLRIPRVFDSIVQLMIARFHQKEVNLGRASERDEIEKILRKKKKGLPSTAIQKRLGCGPSDSSAEYSRTTTVFRIYREVLNEHPTSLSGHTLLV